MDLPNRQYDNNYTAFVDCMRDLVAYALNHAAKFPKRYSGVYTNHMLDELSTALSHVKHANSIRINFKYYRYGKTDDTYNSYREEYEKRTKHLSDAIVCLKAASEYLDLGRKMEITELVADNERVLKEFLGFIAKEIQLIKGVMRSDSLTFKRFATVFKKEFGVNYG